MDDDICVYCRGEWISDVYASNIRTPPIIIHKCTELTINFHYGAKRLNEGIPYQTVHSSMSNVYDVIINIPVHVKE